MDEAKPYFTKNINKVNKNIYFYLFFENLSYTV